MTPSRADHLSAFLAGTQWADATRAPIAGDASNRRYERLARSDGARAILMDAPADKGEDVRPFVDIATYLLGIGLSAPQIFDQDLEAGFLILEDLGDALFKRVLDTDPDRELELYTAAVDALVALHAKTPPPLDPYSPKIMTGLAAWAITYYADGITGTKNTNALARFEAEFEPFLDRLTGVPSVLIQRDYHAENLLWLPDREGVARVGMLDFQDATLGHPAYDLVSILQDARRDVTPSTEDAMIQHYITQTGVEGAAFRAAYAALGVQRNMRIIGIFSLLSLERGKPRYIDLIPRVWGLLERDLDHPALAELAPFIREVLPEPTPDALARLRPA